MHVFADAHAQGLGENPQRLYTVVFEARAVGGSGGAGPVRFRGRVGTVPGAGVIDPAACPGLPRDDADEPVFRAPWEAHAFALVVQLHERGLFTWPEWAAALSAQIRAAQAAGDADLGDTYYRHWLAALEALVAAKGASTGDELARYAHAWDHAAHRTPHGQPIELGPGDLA
ncbi:MAG: nitrile hydratase accessory protein [Burkholderiales bacterium]|nr:nitrile hydratase accessory protein [Burkholderiales bacterium]